MNCAKCGQPYRVEEGWYLLESRHSLPEFCVRALRTQVADLTRRLGEAGSERDEWRRRVGCRPECTLMCCDQDCDNSGVEGPDWRNAWDQRDAALARAEEAERSWRGHVDSLQEDVAEFKARDERWAAQVRDLTAQSLERIAERAAAERERDALRARVEALEEGLRSARRELENYERTDTGYPQTAVLSVIDEIDALLAAAPLAQARDPMTACRCTEPNCPCPCHRPPKET